MLKISDLVGLLNKVQQIAGDVEVALKDAETEAESFITNLGISLDPTSATPTGKLSIEHSPTAPTPPAPAEADQGGSATGENGTQTQQP